MIGSRVGRVMLCLLVVVAAVRFYDWAVFLLVLPLAVPLSLAAAFGVHSATRDRQQTTRAVRSAARAAAYVAAAGCSTAAVTYFIYWGIMFDYADTDRDTPASVQRILDVSYLAATSSLAALIIILILVMPFQASRRPLTQTR
ncbi:MAG: hypothetical protein ACRDV2_06150 [Actinomycetes bacterium]